MNLYDTVHASKVRKGDIIRKDGARYLVHSARAGNGGRGAHIEATDSLGSSYFWFISDYVEVLM